MSVEDQERLSPCCSENLDEQMEPCPCGDSWTGERDLTQIYEMTLRAILDAHQQILNSILTHSVGIGAIQATACRIPASCPTGFTGRYTVRSGDSMFTIAQRCGVTLQALINANPHITNPNVINPCDVLCVPPRCADAPGITCRVPATCPPGFQGRYTVRSGDSMFTIAQRCGVSLQSLINANPHITNPNVINPCDVLCVPLQCATRLASEEVEVELES